MSTQHIAQIGQTQARYGAAMREVDRAREEWHAAIRAAIAAGMPKVEAARLTGLARGYIYEILGQCG